MKPVVLVHGGWHGPWCWERITPALERAGVPWVAVDLPSCRDAHRGCDLIDDAAEVNAVLDGLDGVEPAVVLGHSRGGMVLSEIGRHPRVGHLVYLGALLLELGEKSADVLGDTRLRANIEPLADGATMPGMALAPDIYYNDCTGEDIAWALSNLRPQVLGGRGPSATGDAWRSTPSTYVVCARDRAFHPDGQRLVAARAGAVLEWDTGHSPFISRPDLVSTLLIGLAAG
ncbi:MAG: alpha/beta fold hydrolase [Acidimicrobiales bacterium]